MSLTPPDVLSPHEAAVILAQPNRRSATGLRNRCILELMLRAGLRVSEITNLRAQSVRLSEGRVEVRNSKGGKGRNVPLAQSTVELLERWEQARPRGEWFFGTCCTRGGIAKGSAHGSQISPRYVQQMVRRIATSAGIDRKVTPHTFRHSAATNWLDSGFTIREVQALLGHSDVSTTMIYTHVSDSALVAKMRSLDAVHS